MYRWASGLTLLALALACENQPDAPQKPVAPANAPADQAATKAEPPAPEASRAGDPSGADQSPTDSAALADLIAHETIILDGHVDVPWRLQKSRGEDGQVTEDVSVSAPQGNFDWPRARQGGLDAPFMSIFVSPSYENKGAKKVADELIDMVEGIVESHPDKFALARSPADLRKNFAAGRISLPMGMENGAPIEGKLENVAYFHRRGIRYITLAHGEDNHISDSSYDKDHENGGLSPFGRKVVAEMNRVGIMVDVSHLSDDAFWQVLELSEVPVIASHSSCRHFTPGFERNMSDEMIRALADKGGVIQINFGSGFIHETARKKSEENHAAIMKMLKENGLERDEHEAGVLIEKYLADHPTPRATVEQVADHIEHVIELVGIDHVGFGSDFDGVGDSLPEGLKDVSQYPNLIRVLLERGHRREDIEKICSGNVLRVWQAVEDHAAKKQAKTSVAAGQAD